MRSRCSGGLRDEVATGQAAAGVTTDLGGKLSQLDPFTSSTRLPGLEWADEVVMGALGPLVDMRRGMGDVY